ncbi:MAG: hypothetical protein WAT66_15265 [Actinomycetota bacterium]
MRRGIARLGVAALLGACLLAFVGGGNAIAVCETNPNAGWEACYGAGPNYGIQAHNQTGTEVALVANPSAKAYVAALWVNYTPIGASLECRSGQYLITWAASGPYSGITTGVPC